MVNMQGAYVLQPMGDESSTAQVHPQKLSQALVEAAQEKGAQLRIGEVQNIVTSGKKITGKAWFATLQHSLDQVYALPKSCRCIRHAETDCVLGLCCSSGLYLQASNLAVQRCNS